jgi:macrophage erythroblast attacher
MNENNPPLALPNGYVYSKNALTSMAEANHGFITCPRTSATYMFSACKPAYVL